MVIYKTSQVWSLLLQCLQKLTHLFNIEIILWNENFFTMPSEYCPFKHWKLCWHRFPHYYSTFQKHATILKLKSYTINHLSGPLRKQVFFSGFKKSWFVICGWWISIRFVCFCVLCVSVCCLWSHIIILWLTAAKKAIIVKAAFELQSSHLSGAYFQNREVHTHDKIKVLLRYLKTTHYFSNKNHIFSSDKKNSPGNVAVLVSNMDSFYGILKQKVGWNIPETIQFLPTLF